MGLNLSVPEGRRGVVGDCIHMRPTVSLDKEIDNLNRGLLLGHAHTRRAEKKGQQKRAYAKGFHPRNWDSHFTTLIRWVSRSCLHTSLMTSADSWSSLSLLTPKTEQQDSSKASFPDHRPNAFFT
jgi:hypothetical protein